MFNVNSPLQLLQYCKKTRAPMYQQVTNLLHAGPEGVDWSKLAQNRSWWWAIFYTVVKVRLL